MNCTMSMRRINGVRSSADDDNPMLQISTIGTAVTVGVLRDAVGLLDRDDLPTLIAFLQACQVELAR